MVIDARRWPSGSGEAYRAPIVCQTLTLRATHLFDCPLPVGNQCWGGVGGGMGAGGASEGDVSDCGGAAYCDEAQHRAGDLRDHGDWDHHGGGAASSAASVATPSG